MNTLNISKSLMAMTLENIRQNIVDGIKSAQQNGVACSMPSEVFVDMPINVNGLPCKPGEEVAGRVKLTMAITE